MTSSSAPTVSAWSDRGDPFYVKTRYLIAASLAGAAIFLVPAIFYWRVVWQNTGISPYRCIYGDPICSLTFSTYVLCVVTAAAFIAAFRAYKVALTHLHLEQSLILVQRPYSEGAATAGVQLINFQLGGGEIRPLRKPPSPGASMEGETFQFESIGRAAILDARIILEIRFNAIDEITQRVPVDIGSIRSEGTLHVGLWAMPGSSKRIRELGWSEANAIAVYEGRQVPLTFRPMAPAPFIGHSDSLVELRQKRPGQTGPKPKKAANVKRRIPPRIPNKPGKP